MGDEAWSGAKLGFISARPGWDPLVFPVPGHWALSHKQSLVLVASTWHLLVFPKENGRLSPRKTPCACGWVRACQRDVGLWQSWLSQPAPGVGLDGHRVVSGERRSFPSGTKDLLVLGKRLRSKSSLLLFTD